MPTELLVIEDEVKFARALGGFFERKGFHVETAATAQAALDQIAGAPVEVVLLDLGLPDRSGLDLLPELKDQAPQARVIVISGLTDQATIQAACQRGADEYLTKPVDFSRCLYAAMGIRTVELNAVQIQPAALKRVPVSVANHYGVLPLQFDHGKLELAMRDPLDVQRVDELKALLECDITPLAAQGGNLDETIERAYHYGMGSAQSLRESVPSERQAARAAPGQVHEPTSGLVHLVDELILRAHEHRATDLHLGMGSQGPWLKERIDGILSDLPLPEALHECYGGVVSRIKVMANLDISEHRIPQDGRIGFRLRGTELDLRVSTLPTPNGESLSIRLLDPARTLQLSELGLSDTQRHQIDLLLAKPAGFLLVTGPTGAGKTTTLYGCLATLHTGRVNIVTIEDPIEHELAGVTQVQVHPKIGLTFASGLRSILRHDPDIIMVGEIRDLDTAQLAVRSALTGHMVLSTLHTNDAASAITRHLDLGVPPFLLCSTLTGILCQRLFRLLCQECREPVQVEGTTLGHMGFPVPNSLSRLRLFRARGCGACRMTGYHGRAGVFELLVVDPHIRSLILRQTSAAQIRQSAISRGMQSLWQAGWEKLLAGLTSPDELIRILPPGRPELAG